MERGDGGKRQREIEEERLSSGGSSMVRIIAPHQINLLYGANDCHDSFRVLAVTFSVSKFKPISDLLSCYFATVGTVIQKSQ